MTPSLYERLGGAKGIAAIVDDVVARHLGNPVIKARFAKIDDARWVALKAQLRDFFGAGSGGPEVYTGRDMVAAHLGMNINEQEFIATVDDILAALETRGVAEADRHEVVAILYSLKDQVIRV
jgi:hemoglobin